MAGDGPADDPTPWLRGVRRDVTRRVGAGLGPGWVVAVSGGGDSVALLRCLSDLAPNLGLRLTVAHLDHGVRGDRAAADARFVADLAGELGLPVEVGHWTPTRAAHFEADARRARHAWLADVACRRGAAAVALGHTRDDQAETILHRIVRGTGPAGLAGIPACRPLAEGVALVRPLLGVTRAALRAYLEALGQPFREDPTNDDLARTRARLRHDLIPKLAAAYHPAVAGALVRLGRLVGSQRRALGRHLGALERAATIADGPEGVTLDGAALRGVPPAWRAEVLRRAWRRRGWPESGMDAARWRRLAAAVARARGRFSAGGGVDVRVAEGLVHLVPAVGRPASAAIPPPSPQPIPGSAPWPGGRVVATLDPAAPRDEAVDLDRLVPPLRIYAPAAGDRLDPLGLDGRTQALNDFFRGRRVPREARPRVPLVRDEAGIVWVVGHRIAHRVRTTAATRRTLGLRWEVEGAPETTPPPSPG